MVSDEVVLRSGQWLTETDDPVHRQFLLVPQLTPYHNLRSTLLPGSRLARSTSNDNQDNQTTLTRTRSVHSRWITRVLSALHIPPCLHVHAAEDYLSPIYRMARFDAQVGYYHAASLAVLDRAIALVSATQPTNPAMEFARQGAMQATLVAVACMEREGVTLGFPSLPIPATDGADDEKKVVPLPEPLATLVQTSTKRTTRRGRNTLRSLLAQLSAWKEQCTFVPHLWLDGAPPSAPSVHHPSARLDQLLPRHPMPQRARKSNPSVVGPELHEGNEGSKQGKKGSKGDDEGSEYEDDPADRDEGLVRAQHAAATFASQLVEQNLWRTEIVRCALH